MEEHERERTTMDEGGLSEDADATVRREEDAAAAQAGEIGGPTPDYGTDEADRPVYESGEGEQEGFEEAERELIEHAEHTAGEGTPRPDQMGEEAEIDRAAYGDADGPRPARP